MPLHCSCYDILYPCLLYYFWACKTKCLPCHFHTLFLPSIPAGLIHIASGFPSLFYSLGILGPFHSLGILGPFYSFLLLTFLWVLAKSFGLPWPNYHILYIWVYWPLNQPHLPIPFFGLLRPLFAFFLFLTIPMA